MPEWSFATACLAVGLLPSSSFVALNEMVVDHRAYLGSFGVAFALGDLLARLGGARIGIVVLALFAVRSVHYEWVLGDPVRAWEDVVRRAPTAADALVALGESYAARGDPRAEAALREAVRLGPERYRYWANLGLYYADERRLEEAAAALRVAAEKGPREAAVRDYLGQILVSLGREDEAVAEFEAAIAAEPTFAQPYINLAALWLGQGAARAGPPPAGHRARDSRAAARRRRRSHASSANSRDRPRPARRHRDRPQLQRPRVRRRGGAEPARSGPSGSRGPRRGQRLDGRVR